MQASVERRTHAFTECCLWPRAGQASTQENRGPYQAEKHRRQLTNFRSYCDPKITSAVVEAYEAVWAVIQISEPVRDEKSDCERRAELSQKLASLVVDGVTDPAELRDRALASMSLETIKPANETLLPAS